MSEYPTPTDVKSLQFFIGLASYYCRFIPNFAKTAGPLYTLTQKDVEFVGTPQSQVVFEKLKKLVTSAPVLAFPDFSVPFILEIDASLQGFGAVLGQQQQQLSDKLVRPIAYASRCLQPHEKIMGSLSLRVLGLYGV